MFVLKSKYESLEKRLKESETKSAELADQVSYLRAEKASLAREWNRLVEKINRKGGQSFLDHGVIPKKSIGTDLSQEDIKRLLQLCHPDKHNGKPLASEMTAKLLSLRK